jgi:hypothetical protein
VEQPKVLTAIWNRVVTRPLVLTLAVVAALDWAVLVLLSFLGHVDGMVTAALVVASMGCWFIVLAWYPLLRWLLAAWWGPRGRRMGQFFEQMGIGLLAGLHAIWTVYLAIIAF